MSAMVKIINITRRAFQVRIPVSNQRGKCRTEESGSGRPGVWGAIMLLFIIARTFAATPADPAGKNAYTITPVPGPDGAVLEVGGMDWMPDGRLMVCTRRGEVWSMKDGKWKLFATGLQECLGLLHGETNNDLYVMQRPELTHLIDTKGVGVADKYVTVCSDFGFSGNYHEYAYGPVKDADGNFCGTLNLGYEHDVWATAYMGADKDTPYRGWSFKITPDGKFIPWASGLRSPNGIAKSPDGEIFVMDNQGEFIGADWLVHIKKDAFYGNPSSLLFHKTIHADPKTTSIQDLDKMRTLPAIIFPYGRMGQSGTQPTWDTTGGKFGPYAGQMFVGDMTVPLVMRCTLEKVGGEYQGACYPFVSSEEIRGANRLLFAPDGSLLVGVTDRGWGKGVDGIKRITWNGQTPLEVANMSLKDDGFELTFTKPLDTASAGSPSAYSMLHFHLIYHKEYGSPEADKTPVQVKDVEVSRDGRTVKLLLSDLTPRTIYELDMKGIRGADGSELRNSSAYYTLNQLATKDDGPAK